MVKSSSQVQIQKFRLSEGRLDDYLFAAFTASESENWQLGESWLSNLASNALDPHETAVIFVVHLSADNFIAYPMKLDSHSRQAHSLSTFYTSLYSPLVHSETPEILFRALFQHLIKVEKLTAITLSPMDRHAPEFDLTYRALTQTGWRGLHTFFCFGNWIHKLDDPTYQPYLASRPSQLRNTISRRTRKFLNEERGQLRILRDPESVESAIDDFITVYNKSWKKEEPYPDFIPQLMRMSAKKGWLRLGVAYYNDVPVASQIWMIANGTASIFKLAYDEEYKHLSPGTVLTSFMMEYVINTDAVSTIDYLSGDDNYKKDWMSQRRERHGIAAYNPRTLRGGTMLIGHILKGLYKKLR